MSGDHQLVPSHMESVQPTDSNTQQVEVLMDLELYKAILKGKIGPLRNYGNRLDLVVNASKNSILHIYLMVAASRSGEKSTKFVTEVLEMCPSLIWKVNAANLDTPLHVAARNKSGLPEIVRLLIDIAKEHPEDPESREGGARQLLKKTNEKGDTALHEAARNNHLKMVKILTGEDPGLEYSPNEKGETPIYLAVEGGWTRIVNEILNTCSSVAYDGPGGKTALHAAVMSNDTETVDVLLKKDISLANKTDDYGWTPLHYAAYNRCNKTNMVEKLLEVDISAAYVADRERKMTALHVAASVDNWKKLVSIISKCPDCCRITDIKGWNVFHHMAVAGSVKTLRHTIVKNEDPSTFLFLLNQKDIKGYTPLHIFAAVGYVDLLSIILQKGGVGRHALNEHNSNCNRLLQASTGIVEYPAHHLTKEVREWMEDRGTGPMGKITYKGQWNKEATVYVEAQDMKNAHLIVATLIATVTFAAAFTIPGGVKDDASDSKRGTAILGGNKAFRIFVVSNSLAMLLSTSSVLIHFFLAILGYRVRYKMLVVLCFYFTVYAMVAMVVAFVAGSYAVLDPSFHLTTLILDNSLLFFFVLSLLIKKSQDIAWNLRARNRCYCKACNESTLQQILKLLTKKSGRVANC